MPKTKFTMSIDTNIINEIKKLAIDKGIATSILIENLLIEELKRERKKINKQNFSKNS